MSVPIVIPIGSKQPGYVCDISSISVSGSNNVTISFSAALGDTKNYRIFIRGTCTMSSANADYCLICSFQTTSEGKLVSSRCAVALTGVRIGDTNAYRGSAKASSVTNSEADHTIVATLSDLSWFTPIAIEEGYLCEY